MADDLEVSGGAGAFSRPVALLLLSSTEACCEPLVSGSQKDKQELGRDEPSFTNSGSGSGLHTRGVFCLAGPALPSR